MASRRPEHTGPPEIFYDSSEAQKYTRNTHIIQVQNKLSERALELLDLPEDEPCLLLDLGCGSGLSGETLTENGHFWVGLDVSIAMLDVAIEREVEGDLLLSDLGHGLSFRAGSFDGAISISTLQWLCNADTSAQKPHKRLLRFFQSLYASLKRGSRAVFQFYPENSSQIDLITRQSLKAGFHGGIVVDYPNSTKAKKMYLVLSTGGGTQPLPEGLDVPQNNRTEIDNVDRNSFRQNGSKKRRKPAKKSKDWILAKKARAERQGREVRPDSKYTGRRRKDLF